jgi:hypothetical protein
MDVGRDQHGDRRRREPALPVRDRVGDPGQADEARIRREVERSVEIDRHDPRSRRRRDDGEVIVVVAAVAVVGQNRDVEQLARHADSTVIGGNGWRVDEGERHQRRDRAAVAIVRRDDDGVHAVMVGSALRGIRPRRAGEDT